MRDDLPPAPLPVPPTPDEIRIAQNNPLRDTQDYKIRVPSVGYAVLEGRETQQDDTRITQTTDERGAMVLVGGPPQPQNAEIILRKKTLPGKTNG